MAKTKWRTRWKKARGRRSKSGGGIKPVVDGLIAGVGGAFASKYIGQWGIPAGALGVGWFRHNNVLKVEGAREIGILLAANLPFIGGGGGEGAGGFE